MDDPTRSRRPSALSPKELLLESLIKDNEETLAFHLREYPTDLFKILDLAQSHKSLKCITWILAQPIAWSDPIPNSFSLHTILHRIVIKSGNDSIVLSHVLDLLPKDTLLKLMLAQDDAGRRPLHYAAVLGYDRVTGVLLKHLPSLFDLPGWIDSDGHTPLYLAILRGHDTVVEHFIASPAWRHWNESGTKDGFLLLCCALGHTKIAKKLLDQRVNVFVVNEEEEVGFCTLMSKRMLFTLHQTRDTWKL